MSEAEKTRRSQPGAESPVAAEVRLLETLREGDLAALDLLATRYGAPLRVFLGGIVRDEALVDDLLQDVLLRVFERAPEELGVGSLSPWVYRVARNLALDRLRRRRRRERLGALLGRASSRAPTATPESLALARELGEAFDRALDELPEVLRSAFVLRELERLAYEEIALVLGCGSKTVSSRISRARAQLAGRLRPFLEDLR